MLLGAPACPPQAQLDGFKSRALRATAPTPRHLYATEWRALATSTGTASALALMLCEAPADGGCAASPSTPRELAKRLIGRDTTAVVAVATQRASFALLPVCTLEATLTLAQTQAAVASPSVWLMTASTQLSTRAMRPDASATAMNSPGGTTP